MDWDAVNEAVAKLRRRDRGMPGAEPGDIIRTARRLACRYRAEGRPLPDILAALI